MTGLLISRVLAYVISLSLTLSGLLGGLLGGKHHHGSSGGSYGGGGYQQQPQVGYAQQQRPPNKSGLGMGGMLALGKPFNLISLDSYPDMVIFLGGAGLLGGAFLGEEFERHEEREREDAFLEGEAFSNGLLSTLMS